MGPTDWDGCGCRSIIHLYLTQPAPGPVLIQIVRKMSYLCTGVSYFSSYKIYCYLVHCLFYALFLLYSFILCYTPVFIHLTIVCSNYLRYNSHKLNPQVTGALPLIGSARVWPPQGIFCIGSAMGDRHDECVLQEPWGFFLCDLLDAMFLLFFTHESFAGRRCQVFFIFLYLMFLLPLDRSNASVCSVPDPFRLLGTFNHGG